MGHLTYLVFECGWALPVLVLQWAVGRSLLWRARHTLLITVGLMTVYLSIADGLAIAAGIWTLHGSRILGLRIANLPIEESIFFLVTNAMVAQSVILVRGWRNRTQRTIMMQT